MRPSRMEDVEKIKKKVHFWSSRGPIGAAGGGIGGQALVSDPIGPVASISKSK